MPLDIVQDKLIKLDDNLNFKVAYEPTKMRDHKYVVREDTGEYMGIVGSGFKCASHPAFFAIRIKSFAIFKLPLWLIPISAIINVLLFINIQYRSIVEQSRSF